MKTYLNSIVKQLRNHSLSLNKTSILVDKPWALIDEEFEMQKLIFRRNKSLILSKNGRVQEGKWDYFPEAKALLIDRIDDKILCNEAFVDEGVMILKLDGTEDRFFIFANENVIPDLDVNRYLKELKRQKLNILEKKITDGRIIEVQMGSAYFYPEEGNLVTIDSEPIADGKYQLVETPQYYEIKQGRIFKILTEKKYKNPDGIEIVVQQQYDCRVNHITRGDYVFVQGLQIDNAVINFSKNKNITIKDGILVKVECKNKILGLLNRIRNVE